MLHGTEYQRYKQKLERLQHKVKKSENARRELENKFQRLMRERNECEKSASIHKSKYDVLLEHERKRLNRNEELLQMLEDVQAKANVMASNTEKLKRLKTQQERIVINNWRRSAYFQQHLVYPNMLFSAPGHFLAAPLPYKFHDRAINCFDAAGDNSRPLICDEPTYLTKVQEPVQPKSNDDKSITDTSTVQNFTQPIVREIPYPSIPLMPIYDNDTNATILNEMFHMQGGHLPLQSVKTQPTPFVHQMMAPTHLFDNTQTIHVKELPSYKPEISDHISYFSNPTKTDLTNSHLINNGFYHNKYLNLISSSGNYVPVITPQHKISLDVPLTRLAENTTQSQPIKNPNDFSNNNISSQPYSSIGYANQPHPMQFTSMKNQFSVIEDPSSQNGSGVNVATNLTSHKMHEVMPSYNPNEPIPSYSMYDQQQQIRNKTVEPSIYDTNTQKITIDRIKPRESISISTAKRFDDSVINENSNIPWKRDDLNDVHSYDKVFEDCNNLPRVESNSLRKSMNIPSVTDASNLSSSTHITPKSINKYSLDDDDDDDDIHHIPTSVTSSKSNEIPKTQQYSSVSTTYYQEPLSSIAKIDTENSKKYSFFSNDNEDNSTRFGDKRRSSIDSGSMVKSSNDDSDFEAKSIAANVRRRYSVAANLLDLQKNVTNIEPFYLQSSSTINYRDKNLPAEINRHNFDNENEKFSAITTTTTSIPIVSTLSNGQENRRISIDAGPRAKIEDIYETIGHSDHHHQISQANALTQQPVDGVHDNDYGHTEINDVNHSDISSFREYDNNVMPATSTVDVAYDTNAYSTYETDDQAFVQNAMENLHLSDGMEQNPIDEMQLKQFDDGGDKIRIPLTHSKTVTWADDPDNNYKKQDPTQFYETQNDIQSDTYYADGAVESQQFQTEYLTQQAIEPNDAQYQYDNNQYQAQTDAANQNLYTNEEYYYPDEQANQYQQYDSQSQQQDPQQIQYYANDMIGTDGSSMSHLPDNEYQPYQTESTLLTQPKQDEYYSVSPGENYYSEYSGMGENQSYPVSTTYDNSHELPTSSSVTPEQQHRIQQPQQQQQQQQQQQPQQKQFEYSASNESTVDTRIPLANYLQSQSDDTDDSQIGYQNNSANKIPQNQDSDFDFSTNSDMN